MNYNDASTLLTITTANASNPRIDLICITVSDAYYTGALNQVAFNVVAGTPSGSPVAPSTPANSIALAQVAVGAGVTTITSGNITDVRTLATTSIGLSNSGPYTVANLTATTALTSAAFTQTGTNSIGSLPDSIMALIMGAY